VRRPRSERPKSCRKAEHTGRYYGEVWIILEGSRFSKPGAPICVGPGLSEGECCLRALPRRSVVLLNVRDNLLDYCDRGIPIGPHRLLAAVDDLDTSVVVLLERGPKRLLAYGIVRHGFVELPYPMDFLAPGAELRNFCGSMRTLPRFLKNRGLDGGITITSRYKSLEGRPHKSKLDTNSRSPRTAKAAV
jgi:hypothetical protein